MCSIVACSIKRAMPVFDSAMFARVQAKRRYKLSILLNLVAAWFIYFTLSYTIRPVSSIPIAFTQSIAQKQGQEIQGADTFSSISKWHVFKENSGSNILQSNSTSSTNTKMEAVKAISGLDQILKFASLPNYSCTNPAILEFPPDLFTQMQRQDGAILIHILASVYIFYAIAIICDDYFVPSIETICEEWDLPTDVVGATFMAVATSSPELFTNVIGTFVIKGDIGVGTIVVSAVFNMLAVCACCGYAAPAALPLDWYPLTRDCIFYSISVCILIFVLGNHQVQWYEALILVGTYFVYILALWKNASLKKFSHRMARKIRKYFGFYPTCACASNEELAPLIKIKTYDLISSPGSKSYWATLERVLGWPARLLFTVTVPDCRKPGLRTYYPLTLILCMFYIAILCYFVSWLMTVIGHTFQIPDTVIGLTFIAAGTSIPEAISAIIVAKQGLGSMVISDSIGSNTFDILICLGLPWLIKASIMANYEEAELMHIDSGGLKYSAIILIICLAFLYGLLAFNGFCLDKKVATLATVLYVIFLLFATLMEWNVFFVLNPPVCSID